MEGGEMNINRNYYVNIRMGGNGATQASGQGPQLHQKEEIYLLTVETEHNKNVQTTSIKKEANN